MRVLDLFAGLCGWSQPFADRGHEVYSIDLDERFAVSSHADILTLRPDDLPWVPDIILASPPCESFSVLTIGRNWAPGRVPKTDAARLAIRLVEATRRLIDDLGSPYFVIENPRAMLRTLPPLADVERRTVTYCRYGLPFRKPTDLWGGFPPSLVLEPVCATTRGRLETDDRGLTWTVTPDGQRCHLSAPRGSRTGIQGEAVRTGNHPDKLMKAVQLSGLYNVEYQKAHRKATDEAWLHARATASAEVYGTWDKPTTAALRAKVPYALGLAVCLAAEADLTVGARPIPTMLWGAA